MADNGSEADFSTESDADPAADSTATDGAATGERSVTTDGGKLRFRRSSAITVAAVIMLIAGLSIATWQPYLLVVLVVPLAVAIWGWRAGTDVTAEAVTVRAAVGQRRLPWAQITALRPDGPDQVEAVLTSGGRVTLTAVHPRDLAKVVAAAGARVESSPGQ